MTNYWSFPIKSSSFGFRVRNHVCGKSPEVALGYANARPPGLTMRANDPQLPGGGGRGEGGWAQLEWTDA